MTVTKTILNKLIMSWIVTEVHDDVLRRIEDVNYLENKLKDNRLPKESLIVAQKKFINIH